MSNPNQNKPGGKSGQRSRKPDRQRNQKPEQPASQKPEQLKSQEPDQLLSQEPGQLLSQKPEQLESHKPEPLESQKSEPLESQKPEPQQDSKKQVDAAVASANTLSINFQTIATAYSDYTKKSFEDTKAFVEKLSGVRSLDKAVEIQTEFAKQAYETFVTESQKISELYSGLAKQTFKPLQGFVAKTTRTHR